VANPSTGDKTVVATTDDTTPGQVHVYVGDKRSEGTNPVDRAGLSGGSLYGIKVDGFPSEPAGGIPSGTHFSLANLGDVSGKNGGEIDANSNTAGVTRFLRPEDAAWDTQDPNVLYFATTNAFNSPSRLWRARFDDISNPAAGGTLDELLDGTEGQQMLDNLTVSRRGDLILQEDPGNNPYVARIWRYSPSTDKLVEVAHHDANLFTSGGNAFITQDEESSGVIDASSLLGDGWFLFDDQVHKATTGDPELVERGQLLALHVPPGEKD
jgi:secreted PhoX family phosphatase